MIGKRRRGGKEIGGIGKRGRERREGRGEEGKRSGRSGDRDGARIRDRVSE